MKIIETLCGKCGSKDSLYPVRKKDGDLVWECEDCGGVFEEQEQKRDENGEENDG